MTELEFGFLISKTIAKHPEWKATAISAVCGGLDEALKKERDRSRKYEWVALSALKSAFSKRAHKDYTDILSNNLEEVGKSIFPESSYPNFWKD